jgi:hypothetical protein
MPSISLDSMDDVVNFNPQPLKKKPMLIYIYMTGCPFCEQMKPNWNSFKLRERTNHPDLNILDINQAILPSLVKSHPSMKSHVSNTFSFPDITLHSNQNKYKYQGDRSVPSFEKMVSEILVEETDAKKPKPSSPESKKSKPPSKDDKSKKASKPSSESKKSKPPSKDDKSKKASKGKGKKSKKE